VALLRTFGYRGLAEIEYKRDGASGTPYLIEINTRHWDQHELGTLVGVNLTWIAYRDLVGTPVTKATPVYPPGASCKWIAEPELALALVRAVRGDLAALAQARAPLAVRLAALARAWRELAGLFHGRTILAIGRLRDPVPGLLLSIRSIRQCLQRLVAGPRPSMDPKSRADTDTGRDASHGQS